MPEQEKELAAALERALTLTRAGQLRGGILFLAYHDGEVAFQLCKLTGQDLPKILLMMDEVSANLRGQWFEHEVEGQLELPAKLGVAENEEDG
jgi:hypothetical protein